MGKVYTSVPFFSDDITIEPHTATEADLIGRPVSIREFSAGLPVALERCEETGELYIKRYPRLGEGVCVGDIDFMEGPEVTA